MKLGKLTLITEREGLRYGHEVSEGEERKKKPGNWQYLKRKFPEVLKDNL